MIDDVLNIMEDTMEKYNYEDTPNQKLIAENEKLRRALERIASQEVYEAHPSAGSNYEDMGRYVYPERIKFLRNLAAEALK